MYLLIAVILGLIRVFGEKGQAFQAAAHFYVAGLIVAAYYDKKNRVHFGFLAVALTVLEVVCFFTLKGKS